MNNIMDTQKAKMLGYGLSTSFLVIHIGMLFFFRYFKVTPMVYFNVFSIIFYLLSTLILKAENLWLYSISVYLEVVLHMTMAVICVGAGSGFQVTLIGMNALGFYAEYLSDNLNKRHVSGVALCIIGAVMYLFTYVYSRFFTAPYTLPEDVCFWLQITWGIIVFCVNIFFLKVFVTITTRTEHILADAQTQANSMVTALSSDYRSVYYVNLDNDTAICYRKDKNDTEQPPEGVQFAFCERFVSYGMNAVAESYRDGFMSFIEPENIRESLKERPIISYRYLANRAGHEYYEMIRMAGVRRVEDRDDKKVHSIGLGITVIDEEMRETMAKNEALAEALTLAEDANKAKTSFLSSMSHEMRTPMNAIIGYDKLALRDDTISPETREYLEKINGSAEHLLDLINNILDMSRIESGSLILSKAEFSFGAMLEDVNELIKTQCDKKGLTYSCQIINQINDFYIGDEAKLKEVLLNILGNAVKFTEVPGSVSMSVERMALFEDQSTLQFRITDTGIGMSKEFIPRIFDPFSQEDGSRKNKYGSTGLGMSITKNIVEMMNGAIEVESEKGVGTEVRFSVTLINPGRDRGEEAVQTICEEEYEEISLAGRRILLAEDMEMNAEIMIDLLEMEELEADHAQNGKIAVDMFKNSVPGTYSAILMDIRMPEMDGLEAAEAIRALNREDAKRIPIIALTANAFDEDIQRSLQAGMNAHLTKPVDTDHLFQVLRELIKNELQVD